MNNSPAESACETPPRRSLYGNRAGYAFFRIVLRVFGLRPAYICLAFLIPWYVFVRRSARRLAAPYLARRFPHRGPLWRFPADFVYFFRFGQSLLDQAALLALGPERLRVDFPGSETLAALAANARGLVLLTSHVGNWQTAVAHLDCLNIPVAIQLRRDAHSEGIHFFHDGNSPVRFRHVSPDDFAGGMIEMTRELQDGHCVAIMGDRAFGTRTRTAPFLGEPAHFPIAPYRLALATDAPVVVFLTARTGPLAYRIDCRVISDGLAADLDRDAAEAELLRRYVDLLEAHLERHPFSWFNFFDFWSPEKTT